MVQVSLARGWDLEVDRGPDWLFVRPLPLGDSRTDLPSLAEQVAALLEQTLVHRLVLDLSTIDRFDAELIDQLCRLHQRIHAAEGLMRVCGLSPVNEQLLRKHDRAGLIAHYCDREAAVMGEDRPRQPR